MTLKEIRNLEPLTLTPEQQAALLHLASNFIDDFEFWREDGDYPEVVADIEIVQSLLSVNRKETKPMNRDEETDQMVQQAKELLDTTTESSLIGQSLQAIGILMAALVLETRALRSQQEVANRLARITIDEERNRFHMLHNIKTYEVLENRP